MIGVLVNTRTGSQEGRPRESGRWLTIFTSDLLGTEKQQIFPLLGRCSEGLDAFDFSLNKLRQLSFQRGTTVDFQQPQSLGTCSRRWSDNLPSSRFECISCPSIMYNHLD